MARGKLAGMSPMGIIGAVVGLAIAFWVGQTILDALVASITQTTINDSTGYFYQGYRFMGLATGTTGILAIVAVLVVAGLAMRVLKIRM